jgi:hypothetical protein
MLLWLFQSCRRRATYSNQVAAMCHVGLPVPQCEWCGLRVVAMLGVFHWPGQNRPGMFVLWCNKHVGKYNGTCTYRES